MSRSFSLFQMFAAVRANDLGTLKKLLAEGASLKDREGGKSVLCECVQQNNVDAVKILFEFGASIDEGETVETTPLLLAIRKKSDELVELLLSNGANPNVAVKVANVVQTYEEGSWPLLEASISGRFSTVHSLLQKGADINFAPFDKHPATEAFIRNHHHIASYLIHQIVGLDKSTIGAKYKPTSGIVDSGALQNLQQRFAALLKREIIGDILFSPPVVQSAPKLIEEFQPEQKARWRVPLQKAKSSYNRTNLLIKKKGKVGINPFSKKASKEKMDLWDSDSKFFKEQLEYAQVQHELYTNLSSNSRYFSQKFTEACNTVDDLRDIVDKVVQNPNSSQANAIVEHIKRLTDYSEKFQKRAGPIVQGTMYLEEAHKNVQQIQAAAVRERNARMISGMCAVAGGVAASSSAECSLRSAEATLNDSAIQLNGMRTRVKLGANFETNWARAQQYLPDLNIGLEATDNRTRLANYKVGVPRVSDWSRYLQLHQLLIDGIIQSYQNSLVLWKVWAVEQNIGK